ncbi:MAG: molybdopterin-binding protein [Negativicutes bacterium]|nr:molybdopterin-binding protein [Negativicutes bacterium]
MELNLLEKTELKIYGLAMESVNLSRVAEVAAAVLELPPREVLVVDVRADHIFLDILVKTLDIRQIIGKEVALLDALRTIEGLVVREGAYIDSAGVMGLIGCGEDEATAIAARVESLGGEIERGVLKRALVFATGFEVQQGMIEDTNSPYLIATLREWGYAADFGGILEDDADVIAHRLRDAAERGFGLVITTGGVGAEDKDFSVEALTRIDREAATPWIVKFQAGTGRHVKEGVRIGVGQYGLTTYVNLPGPHDEVVAAAAALVRHCDTGRVDKNALAGDVVQILREKLQHKHWHAHSHHERRDNHG